MTEGGNSPVVNGGVADLQLDHETTGMVKVATPTSLINS